MADARGWPSPSGREILIEHHEVTSDVEDVTFSGLSGYGVYRAECQFILGAGTQYYLNPNGLTTNQATRGLYYAGGAPGSLSSTRLLLTLANGLGATAGDHMTVHFSFGSYEAAFRKFFKCHMILHDAGNASQLVEDMGGGWNSTAEITSLVFAQNGGAGEMKAGSVISLYFTPSAY